MSHPIAIELLMRRSSRYQDFKAREIAEDRVVIHHLRRPYRLDNRLVDAPLNMEEIDWKPIIGRYTGTLENWRCHTYY